MAIEHRNLPESGLHEPKGVSGAPSKRVYRSNGTGSGSWAQVDSDTLAGTINNASAEGLGVVTDGAGGLKAQPPAAGSFGSLNLTGNTVVISVPAAVDPTLNTISDYVEITLAFTFAAVQRFNTGSNYLEIIDSGNYLIDFWANVETALQQNTVGFKFEKNGSFVPRAPKTYMSAAGEVYNISGNGIHDFVTGDRVKLYVASVKATNILITDTTFSMLYMGGL